MLPNLKRMLFEADVLAFRSALHRPLSTNGPAAHAPTMATGKSISAKTVPAKAGVSKDRLPRPTVSPGTPGPHRDSRHAAALTKQAVHVSNRMAQVAQNPKGNKGVAGHNAAIGLHSKAYDAHAKAAVSHAQAAKHATETGEHTKAKFHSLASTGHQNMMSKHKKYIGHHAEMHNQAHTREVGKHMAAGKNYGDAALSVRGSLARVKGESEGFGQDSVVASKKAVQSKNPIDHASASELHRKAGAKAYKAGNEKLAHQHIKLSLMHKTASAAKKLRVGEETLGKYGMSFVGEVLSDTDVSMRNEAFDNALSDLVESPPVGTDAKKIDPEILLRRREALLASHDALKSNREKDHQHAAGLHSALAQHFHKAGHYGLANHHMDMAYNHVEAGMAAPKKKKKLAAPPVSAPPPQK